MYAPRAAYSFRMSFCTVPDNRSSGTPRRRATATYIARMKEDDKMVFDTLRISL
jgi:hypothetical protein